MLTLLADELSNSEIGGRIFLSADTLRDHVSELTRILQVADGWPEGMPTMQRELTAGRDVLLIGPSASGKTTSAMAMAMAYLTRGWPVVMLDLVADTTVRMPDATRVLLIVDNIQANVAVAQQIGDLLTRRRKSSGLAALLIGWPSAHELATTLSPGALLITTQGTDVIAELVRQTHAATGDIMHISELAAGDVVVARAAIDHYTDFGAVPAADELMAIIAERTGARRHNRARDAAAVVLVRLPRELRDRRASGPVPAAASSRLHGVGVPVAGSA